MLRISYLLRFVDFIIKEFQHLKAALGKETLKKSTGLVHLHEN